MKGMYIMKKILVFGFILLLICTLVSCTNNKTYSLKEAGGFEISNISGVSASESVYQSSAWPISIDAYQYLDCKYIKVDFNIQEEYLSSWPSSEEKDDAYCLYVDVENVDTYIEFGPIFYISHNTGYMYFDGIDGTYRSKNPVPNNFIEMIKADYYR